VDIEVDNMLFYGMIALTAFLLLLL